MPLPIKRVNDSYEIKKESQDFDLSILLPYIGKNFSTNNDKQKLKEIWLHGNVVEKDKVIIGSTISQQDLSLLKNKGLLSYNNNIVEFTSLGKKLLRESILNDEQSTLLKTASKKMICQNSYDFDNEVLVRVNHPENFGTRFITISKKVFAKNDMLPKKISSYNIKTKKENGRKKMLAEYTDDELIKILHMTKNIIKNASVLSIKENGRNFPINRLKCFSEKIMEELNRHERNGNGA